MLPQAPVCDICHSEWSPSLLPIGELSYQLENFLIKVMEPYGSILDVGSPFTLCDRCADALDLTPDSTEVDNGVFFRYWERNQREAMEKGIRIYILGDLSRPRGIRRADARRLRKIKYRLFEG